MIQNFIFDEQQQKKALVPTEDIENDWIQLNYDDSNWLDVESVSEDGTSGVEEALVLHVVEQELILLIHILP